MLAGCPRGHATERLANCSRSAALHRNMHPLKCAFIVVYCDILSIRGEHWYYADKSGELGLSQNIRDPLYDQRVIPDTPIHRMGKYKRQEFEIDYARPYHNIGTETIPKLNDTDLIGAPESNLTDGYHRPVSNGQKRVEVIRYNNTINFINIVKKVKPRRKTIRRRCPNQRVRHRKKLSSNQTARATKFLEIFEVIQFENVACTSSSGLEGICLHQYECESTGGATMGTCADGYGTCCVTQFLCDAQSSEPIGWFTNPGFPSPSTDRLSCTFTLNKSSGDVTQIRLDLVTFELLPPNAGACQQDQFIVSGQNTNSIIPILCGINTGQHVYIEVGDIEGPIYLSVQTISPENRLYSIKVTQLAPADDLIAPPGCLQYFTEEQGILESFNYREKTEIGIPRVPSYLNNLNYAMCISRAPGTCSVTYTNADYIQIVNYDLDGLPVIPQGQAGVEIFNCPGDWLLIAATRLCGERLNDGAVLQDFALDAPITDNNAGPIAVWFRTDEGYAGRGFKIQYQQNACNGPPYK